MNLLVRLHSQRHIKLSKEILGEAFPQNIIPMHSDYEVYVG